MLLFAGDHRCLRCAVLHTHVQSLSTTAALPRRRAGCGWRRSGHRAPAVARCSIPRRPPYRRHGVAVVLHLITRVAIALCTSARARDPAIFAAVPYFGTLTSGFVSSSAALFPVLRLRWGTISAACWVCLLGPHVVEKSPCWLYRCSGDFAGSLCWMRPCGFVRPTSVPELISA